MSFLLKTLTKITKDHINIRNLFINTFGSYVKHHIQRQDLAALSRKRHVLAKPSAAQQEATCSHLLRCFANGGGGLRLPQPPARFFARSNALPSYSMFCKWGGLRPPQPPRSYLSHRIRRQDLASLSGKRLVPAKPSQAQQDATCSHLIRCFANGGGLRPPQPPAFFWGSL